MDIFDEYPNIDELGNRYRVVHGIMEYMPTVATSGGVSVPLGTAIAAAPELRPVPAPRKCCPLSMSARPECADGCAFLHDGQCTPGKAEKGRRCPLPARCTCGDNCAMYDDGRCTFFAAGRRK